MMMVALSRGFDSMKLCGFIQQTMHSAMTPIFAVSQNGLLAMQCRSCRDAFLATMVHAVSEVIDVLILLAWRVALGTIDRYGSFDCI